MPELFLELFSEEIPARMQARAAEDLARLLDEALAPLEPRELQSFAGPRRLALSARVAPGVPQSRTSERGPRRAAPEQALAGFLRKHGATADQLREAGGFWVLDRVAPGITAAELIGREVPKLLRRFPWPKSMRWGSGSGFTWVRPLHRILCILDGQTVPFDLRDGEDDGHGLASGNLTEGHRFLAPGAFGIASCAEWRSALLARHVVVEAAERRRIIWEGVTRLAAERGVAVLDDADLLDEVAGLVEWPTPLLGAIDPAYMDLPPEVMRVSMRVNQRYFATRRADGGAAPFFAFVANIEAPDGGAAIIAGNERVLRARFADARHFWDHDRTVRLAARLPALDLVTFHARLGSQGERVQRLERLAGAIAPLVGADPDQARRAARLSKADLSSGMVGEFPELQGVMGRYYALHDGEAEAVADAIRDHYAPKGPGDGVPGAPVAVALALADKLDLLAAFFGIGEKPTGSSDPYALRRAALGIIRIIREGGLRLGLRPLIELAGQALAAPPDAAELLGFLAERLRVQLRAEGARHDVLAAVLGTGLDDDLLRLLARTDAVTAFLATDDGANLLTAYRRAANILRIEERKDGPHDGPVDPALFRLTEENSLALAINRVEPRIAEAIRDEAFAAAMAGLAALRPALDSFFDRVTVNDAVSELRRNRLRLLARVRAAMNRAADFSRIEG